MSMIYYSLLFLACAVVAGILGFTVVAGTAAMIAKILFLAFLVLTLLTMFVGRKPTP